jgi:hypothetical protein
MKNADSLLRILLPFVPAKKRTMVGAGLLAVGTIAGAFTSPELLALLPASWGKIVPLIQGWGAAAAMLGLRAAMPETKE